MQLQTLRQVLMLIKSENNELCGVRVGCSVLCKIFRIVQGPISPDQSQNEVLIPKEKATVKHWESISISTPKHEKKKYEEVRYNCW